MTGGLQAIATVFRCKVDASARFGRNGILAGHRIFRAGVAELAYAADSKSAAPCGRVGSSPTSGTRGSRPQRARAFAFASLLGSVLLFAGPTGAQVQMHEFTGRVDRVTESALVVHNRMGDRVSFARSPDTEVEGVRERWESIRAKDRVTVLWKFADSPRRAMRVVVLSGAK